jgi:hypothetical protein
LGGGVECEGGVKEWADEPYLRRKGARTPPSR